MSQGMIANNSVIWQLLVQPRSYTWHNGRNQRDPVKENPANIIQLSSLDDCGLVLGSTVWGVTTRALNVSWTAFPGVRWQIVRKRPRGPADIGPGITVVWEQSQQTSWYMRKSNPNLSVLLQADFHAVFCWQNVEIESTMCTTVFLETS